METLETLNLIFLILTCMVVGGGGFAPSIAPPPPTQSPSTTTEDSNIRPAFLGHHNVTVKVHAGNHASLDCHVVRLGDKTVSWVRRRGADFHILTVGFHTYHNDNRYGVSYVYPNNWRLAVRYAQKRDEGTYECQISTHPPKIRRVFLSVQVPEMTVVDSRGSVVREKYYRVDSTVGLQCLVFPAAPNRAVHWYMNGDQVTTQPHLGIRVESGVGGGGVTSWLHIDRAAVKDSGNYTCTAGDNVDTSVRLHVLDGEQLSAAMQHSNTDSGTNLSPPSVIKQTLTAVAIYVIASRRIFIR